MKVPRCSIHEAHLHRVRGGEAGSACARKVILSIAESLEKESDERPPPET